MGLADVHLTTRTNVKILATSVAFVVVGGFASILPVYGWVLSIIFGVVAIFLSLNLQRIELNKTFQRTLAESIKTEATVGHTITRSEG